MSTQQQAQPQDMSTLVNRLKARLALANFKREHGYENVDLRTLESNLYHEQKSKLTTSPTIIKTMSQFERDKKLRRKILLSSSHHRFYPTSPPLQHNDTMDRLIKKNASRSLANVPLSETRLQHAIFGADSSSAGRKLSLSSDDEDAAHLLVMMHQSPTMSS